MSPAEARLLATEAKAAAERLRTLSVNAYFAPSLIVASEESERLADAVLELADECERLNTALDAALANKIGDHVLIDIMQRRYGCEAQQWKANHDRRKEERDEARAECERLERRNIALAVCSDAAIGAICIQRDDVRVERDTAIRERDAALAECERLRAERDEAVTLLGGITGADPEDTVGEIRVRYADGSTKSLQRAAEDVERQVVARDTNQGGGS